MTRLRALLLALCALTALSPAPATAQENDSSPGIAAPAPQGGSAEPQTNLADIEDEVMCPICGTTLGVSQAPQADRQREFIRELIARGRTKEEIKDALVAQYGDEVLAVPEPEGFDLAAWLVPGVAILLAGAAIAVGVVRWRRRPGSSQATAPSRLSAAEEERLRLDLSRYDE